MQPYQTYSIKALKAQLADIKKLKILVNTMQKPDTFTYIDVVNLHTHLEELEKCITQNIYEKEKTAI